MVQADYLRIPGRILPVAFFTAAMLILPEISYAIDGGKTFGAKCVACHGPKGEGTQVGPSLKGDPFVIDGTPAELKKVIMGGRSDKEKKYPKIMNGMPAGLASDAEADALVVFLKGDLQK